MRLLLDTCVFIWLASEPKKISTAAAAALNAPENELLFSHASVWEICLKSTAGKLSLPDEPERWLRDQIVARGVTELAIDFPSLTETPRLPPHHRDPFDRLLVAQAQIHSLKLVSPDPLIAQYRSDVVW